MPYEKAPSSGAFLPLSLMYFLSGEPMHDLSGVDTSLLKANERQVKLPQLPETKGSHAPSPASRLTPDEIARRLDRLNELKRQ